MDKPALSIEFPSHGLCHWKQLCEYAQNILWKQVKTTIAPAFFISPIENGKASGARPAESDRHGLVSQRVLVDSSLMAMVAFRLLTHPNRFDIFQ
jgi:hypothetical protein